MSLKPKSSLICLCILLCAACCFAQTENYPPPAQVAADLHKLLDRPKVPFNASFETIKTDSAIIEHGYFYSEQNEKVPTLICVKKHGAQLSNALIWFPFPNSVVKLRNKIILKNYLRLHLCFSDLEMLHGPP